MVDRRWQVNDLLETKEVYSVDQGKRIIENDIEPFGDEVALELRPVKQLGIGQMGKQGKEIKKRERKIQTIVNNCGIN